MKIKFKNFQALKAEEIEINPGVTLIVGPTDSGKTAIFRGLLSLLTNSIDAPSFINGAALQEKGDSAELAVTVIDEDIPEIEFHRTPGKAWYMINGKKYSKLARSNIFDIYPDMHKKFVYDPNDSRKILNFQTEEQLAFPFDKSDAEMFKLFEHIFNIADTRAIMDTIRKEEDSVNFKLSQNQTEKTKLESDIAALKQSISGVNKDLLLNYAEQYKNCYGSIQNQYSKLSKIASYVPFLKTVQELPEFLKHNDEEICNEASILEKKLQECLLKESYVKNYTDVQLTPIKDDFDSVVLDLRSKLDKIQVLEQNITAQEKLIKLNENVRAEAEKELEEFDICPLCGHTLKGEK